MSASTVITQGYGSFGSAPHVITLGYGFGAAAVIEPDASDTFGVGSREAFRVPARYAYRVSRREEEG